jgi:hypothetical protein
MDVYDSICQSGILNEQIARAIFEIVPEQGPLVMILDHEDNCWSNNSEKFAQLNFGKEQLQQLCAKIGDGVEPVISYIEPYGIVGSQLGSDSKKYGYILVVMEEQGLESMLAKIEIFEMILNQFNLIAKLIEQCNSLYQEQMKLSSPVLRN